MACIDLIGKPADGIRLTPALAGRWRWVDDRSLEFAPDKAWLAGTRFSVDFPATIFSSETRLKKADNGFLTPAFEAAIESLGFYQEPTDSAVRRVVATRFFSHPVATQSLEAHLSMAIRPSGEGMQTPHSGTFDIRAVDGHGRAAHTSLKAEMVQ